MERWGYTFWKYPFLKHGMRNCFFYPFTYYTQCISLSPGCWFSVCLGAMFPISTLQFLGQEPPQEVPVSILVELKGSVSVCGLEVQCGYKYKHKNNCVIHKNASWPLKVIVGLCPVGSWSCFTYLQNQDTLRLSDAVWRTCNTSGFQEKRGTFQLHLRGKTGICRYWWLWGISGWIVSSKSPVLRSGHPAGYAHICNPSFPEVKRSGTQGWLHGEFEASLKYKQASSKTK